MLHRLPSEKFHPNCVSERRRQGSGSTGIWACMTSKGLGLWHLFDGRLNQYEYVQILQSKLIPSILTHFPGDTITFQHDNAPCHRANSVQNWLKEKKLSVLTWPPNSPDLNPIENMWAWLDIQIGKAEISSLNDLHLVINETLRKIPIEIINNLFSSMPNRINECLKARGGFTRY